MAFSPSNWTVEGLETRDECRLAMEEIDDALIQMNLQMKKMRLNEQNGRPWPVIGMTPGLWWRKMHVEKQQKGRLRQRVQFRSGELSRAEGVVSNARTVLKIVGEMAPDVLNAAHAEARRRSQASGGA